jgi:hypothetical protein
MARSARVTADRIGALLMQATRWRRRHRIGMRSGAMRKFWSWRPEISMRSTTAVTPREICAGCRGAVPLDVAAVVRAATPRGLAPSPRLHFLDAPRASARGRVFKSVNGCLPPRRGAVMIRFPLLHRPRMSKDR